MYYSYSPKIENERNSLHEVLQSLTIILLTNKHIYYILIIKGNYLVKTRRPINLDPKRKKITIIFFLIMRCFPHDISCTSEYTLPLALALVENLDLHAVEVAFRHAMHIPVSLHRFCRHDHHQSHHDHCRYDPSSCHSVVYVYIDRKIENIRINSSFYFFGMNYVF